MIEVGRTTLSLRLECSLHGIEHEAPSWGHQVEASLLFSLTEGRRRVYGADFAPGPYRKKLLALLERLGEHSEANDVIQFTVTSERNLMSILETVNWVDSMVCRLDVRPLAELQIPQMKRGLFGKRPFDWFEEHLKDCDILCYLGIHPYLGIDVKSCRVSFPDLWSLMAPTCVQLGVNITKADLQGTEGEMGNTAGPRQELLP